MTIESSTQESFCNTDIGALPAAFPEMAPNIMTLFSLSGKSAVVTGGARGIGYAISEAYLQAGLSKLAIVDYAPDAEAFKVLSETFPKARITYYNCDVRKAEQVKEVISQIQAEFQIIDIFVANAGIAWTSGAMIDQETDFDWHNVMNVDLNGVYYCANNIGRIFRTQGFGSLVMTASMSAHIVNVPQLQAAYNVAKAGVLHLGKSLAIEWAAFARVNTISPGYIATELSAFVPMDMKNKWYAMIPKGREGLPRELCGAYLYLASDASSYTTGSDIKVDGGYCSV